MPTISTDTQPFKTPNPSKSHHRWLGPLALTSGLSISAVAAYFSVYGLSKLFTSSLLAGFVVFGVLEIGKLVAASWTYRNWKLSPKVLRTIMAGAVGIMMGITSLGIYGYLSESYTLKLAPVQNTQVDLTSLDQRIAIQTEKNQQVKDQLSRLNRSLDARQQHDSKGTSIWTLHANQKTIDNLSKQLQDGLSNLAALQSQRAQGQITANNGSTDLGPLVFLAKTFFGDGQENLDKAIRIMIGLLVLVFDPLAICLLLAANFSFEQQSKEKQTIDGPIPVTQQELDAYLGTR